MHNLFAGDPSLILTQEQAFLKAKAGFQNRGNLKNSWHGHLDYEYMLLTLLIAYTYNSDNFILLTYILTPTKRPRMPYNRREIIPYQTTNLTGIAR